jgi:hypothetical protein
MSTSARGEAADITEVNDVREHQARLTTNAARLWAGEAEVVRVYFSHSRTVEQDLFWLTAQAVKEASPLRLLPKEMRAELLRTGGASLNGSAIETRILQEAKHFKLIADLVSELRGTPIDIDGMKPLPEDVTLHRMRTAFERNGGDLERAAVGFTEGGGGSMFWELSLLDRDALERRIASIFREIYDDELSHGWPHLDAIARHARTEADWLRAEKIVGDISRQRIRMRNEMFGSPLSPARVREIDEGTLDPWMAPGVA